MKIGSLETKPPVPTPAEHGTKTDHGRKGDVVRGNPPRVQPMPVTAAPPDASTNVTLSSAAKELGSIKDESGFDAKKVERIASAIRAGTFKVNPEAIADKLIANAAELLARKPN